MKILLRKLIYLSILILSVSSCTDELFLSPISTISVESFWQSEDDVKGALYGMYHEMRSDATENLFLWGEARSDIWMNNYTADLDRNHIFLNQLTMTKSGPNWSNMYRMIHTANLILKYAPKVNFPQEANRNNILAQAHAMRAYAYFTMTKVWGELIMKTEPTEGVASETIYRPRSPQSEIFQLIKKDIDNALVLFSSNNFSAGRNTWSKPAVNALKADVYLWTGKRLNGGNADFTVALNAANDAAASDVTLLSNYKDVFAFNNKGNKEILMAVRYHDQESGQRFIHGLIHPANAPNPLYTDSETMAKISPVGPFGSWQLDTLVTNQFSDDDQRKDGTFVKVYETISGVTRWKYNTDQKWLGVLIGGVRGRYDDFIIYRYSDIILMKAEAKNALGQDPSVEINMIRERAYRINYPAHIYIHGSKEENDEAILRERLFEFIHEGKRWWDLIRFGKVFEKVNTLKDRVGQNHLLLFPIAEGILSQEPLVEQNPGYGYSK